MRLMLEKLRERGRPYVAALFIVAILANAAGAFAKVPVILSTDVGNEIDDQWAIAYMLANPQTFDVLGIVSSHAPSLPDPSAHYTYLILKDEVENRLGLAQHPPLFEGASVPLQDDHTPIITAGVTFIIDASKNFSSNDRLTILTIGAATDVASAIIEDPTIANRIRVVAMAFTSWPDGGNEFNVANDVKAWQVILNSKVPVVIGSGSVCRADLSLSLDQAKQLVGNRGPVGEWLYAEFAMWYFRNVKPLRRTDFSKKWVIWDTITLAYVEGLTTQETHPRPTLSDAMQFGPGRKGETVTWITSVDSKRMWADFTEKLDFYQSTHRVPDFSLDSVLH
ncbi:MAG TPA: nucleoside hydrolase [Candidatus Acidoferrales bacterium]|nr:nucleoside hydrolase [Candidatus Acidoferrales bacterium]